MGRVKTPVDSISVEDAFAQLRAGIKLQAVEPNIFAYKPHEKQVFYHASPLKKKLFIGGNRSGKTLASVAEDIWWATGTHPYRETPPPPIRGRVVAVDFLQGVEMIIKPLFKRLCPPSLLRGGSFDEAYDKQHRTLNFANGSTIEFMSYDQDLDKFAGTSRHFIHYDEEPPKHIFNECGARLIDTAGSWWISMTPVDGMTWIYEDIFEPGQADNKTFIIEVEMLDNPHITKEAAEDYLSGLDEGERKAREKGQFVQLGGRVYKSFTNPGPHIIPPININDPEFAEWKIHRSMDHGFHNPTAWLWHAVSPSGEVITFAEHYEAEKVIAEHASAVTEITSRFNKQPELTIGDPAIAQRNGVTGNSIQTEYAQCGLYISLGNNDVVLGVTKVNSYLRVNPETGRSTWRVTENCVNLIKEMAKLRWATFSSRKSQFENNAQEKIHKKDDHASDALRYFVAFMPDLSFTVPGTELPQSYPLGNKIGAPPGGGSIDEVLKQMGAYEPGNNVSREVTQWRKKSQGSDIGALEYE